MVVMEIEWFYSELTLGLEVPLRLEILGGLYGSATRSFVEVITSYNVG
jgi:hypothetical protein